MSEQDVDWSVLEYPGVKDVARKAAAKVASDYESLSTVDFDDLHQEALILLATNGQAQTCLADPELGLGVLYHRTVMDLVDKVKYVAGHAVNQVSYEVVEQGARGVAAAPAPPAPVPVGSDYSRELVEQLLPAVWDSTLAYGMVNPTAPDPDMPRGTVDPSHGCTLYAHLADIKTAWRKAYLPLEEKQALLLRYGLGWREREIGEQQGVAHQRVSERLARGVTRLRDYLNGVEHVDLL